MNKPLLASSVALIIVGALALLHAARPTSDSNKAGDPGSVNTVAVGQEKANSCAGCHGKGGNSVVAAFPKLAGQHPGYLVSQLQAFKEGVRKDPVMAPMAMPLNDGDMRDIAAYYAVQGVSAEVSPQVSAVDDSSDTEADEGKTKETLLAKGANLYRNGNLKTALSACIACHGPSGEGNKPASFPALRSQHDGYLVKALTDFKSGLRSDNPDNMMVMVAKKMSEADIKAVSYYISSLN